MHCPKCNCEIDDLSRFCSECGARIPIEYKKCPKCGKMNRVESNFCTFCGSEFSKSNKTTEIKSKKEYGLYKGRKSKYYREYEKLDSLGGISYLNERLANSTPKEIAKELFNLDDDEIIRRYYRLYKVRIPKIDKKPPKTKESVENYKILDLTITCPICGHVQDKKLHNCEECGYNFITKTKFEKHEPKICPNCARQLEYEEAKCINCGYDFANPENNLNKTVCPKCDYINDPRNATCINCGYKFIKIEDAFMKCPECGKMILKDITKCPHCDYDFLLKRVIKRKTNVKEEREEDEKEDEKDDYYQTPNYHHEEDHRHQEHNPNNMTPGEIEQAMEGGLSNRTSPGVIEQINEILHDTGDDML